MNPDKSKTSKRKKEHLELCLTDDVSFKRKSTGFENYEFKHEQIGQLGATIGRGIYESKNIRKDLKKVIKIKGISWYEESDNMLARVKLKNYQGNPVITYWEKLVTQNEWAIPFEITRIWHHIRLYQGDEAQQIVDNLAAAFVSQDEKTAQQAINDIGNYISEEDKRRKQAKKDAKKLAK